MICPKCEMEYVDNITECTDCQTELISVEDFEGNLVHHSDWVVIYTTDVLYEAQMYKANLEGDINRKVQSMLEGIVGPGKAIVRTIAEIDFREVTQNEEEYSPETIVRSNRRLEELTTSPDTTDQEATLANQRSGVLPSSTANRSNREKRKWTRHSCIL